MNPIATAGWFWRAWRARSITFAALFALSLLGVSVLGGFRHLMRGLGLPWYGWLLVPFIVVAVLARKEAEWMPDAAERRKWAQRIVIGAIVLALALAKFAPEPKRESPTSMPPGNRGGRADPHRH